MLPVLAPEGKGGSSSKAKWKKYRKKFNTNPPIRQTSTNREQYNIPNKKFGGNALAVRVFLVHKTWEADVRAYIVKDRREAQMIVYPVKERWDAQTRVFLVSRQEDADLKVFVTNSLTGR